MGIVLLSILLSAATTIVITAIVEKTVVDYVNEVCDINLEQVKKIKECAIKNVETLVCTINRNKSE